MRSSSDAMRVPPSCHFAPSIFLHMLRSLYGTQREFYRGRRVRSEAEG
jgi:hypothetical protein